MNPAEIGEVSWERMILSVERVRDRLLRASHALQEAQIEYAIIGGNAVAAWVSRVDISAVRNTQDVDVLLRRTDLEKAKIALAKSGFVFRHANRVDMFLDGPDARARDAVHIVFAQERVRPDYLEPAPDVEAVEKTADGFQLLKLEDLVLMKLTSFRLKDQVHLQDLASVGLIDISWCNRFRPELAARLREIIENPDS
jgi:hypothetical protein